MAVRVRAVRGWWRSAVGAVQVGAVRVPKFRAFFPFPTFFNFFEAFQVFFVDLCRWFGRFISKNCAKHTSLEFSGHLVKPRRPPKAGSKVVQGRGVQGRAVRGRRVQGWRVQGRCYRLKKRGFKNKSGLNNIWSGLKKHMARSSKT